MITKSQRGRETSDIEKIGEHPRKSFLTWRINIVSISRGINGTWPRSDPETMATKNNPADGTTAKAQE
jgi:hypothetical protein